MNYFFFRIWFGPYSEGFFSTGVPTGQGLTQKQSVGWRMEGQEVMFTFRKYSVIFGILCGYPNKAQIIAHVAAVL